MNPASSAPYNYTVVSRGHALFTSAMTLCAALLFFTPDFPFTAGFLGVCITSSAFHLFLYLIFPWANREVLTTASLINIVMLAASVHFTGGVLSPFTAVFVLVLISGAGYSVRLPLVLAACVGSYTAVILAEKYGLIVPPEISSAQIYRSWPATAWILISVVGFMLSAGSLYKQTVNHLRQKVATEIEIKESMKLELSRLEAPSQVGLLVHRIVHDLRGPLSSVGGFIELVRQDDSVSDEYRRDCDVILSELQRVNGLITRMLTYVKPGQGTREPLCPRDVVETVLSVFSFFPGAKDVKIETDFSPPGSFLVWANRHELQQVFFNIFKNSVEAFFPVLSGPAAPTPRFPYPPVPDRAIRVRLTREDRSAVATISDNGPGIPEGVLNALAHDAVSTKPQGGGIGLLIVRDILEAHGGALKIKSRPGDGTQVTITLPIYDSIPKEKNENPVRA